MAVTRIEREIISKVEVLFHDVSSWALGLTYSSDDFVDSFGFTWCFEVHVETHGFIWILHLRDSPTTDIPMCSFKVLHDSEESDDVDLLLNQKDTYEYRARRYNSIKRFVFNDSITVKLTIKYDEYPKTKERKRNLLGSFSSFEEMERMHDFTLIADDTRIPTMKHVLAAQSSVFAAMLQHPMKETEEAEVTISDYSAAVVRAFNHYCFTAEVSESLSVKEGIQLLQLADKYDVRDLREACALYLSDNMRTKEEAEEVLPLAYAMKFKKLLYTAAKIIGCNAPY